MARKKTNPWSKPATAVCGEAMTALVKVKLQARELAARSLELQAIIVQEGGGTFGDLRATLRKQSSRTVWRKITTKEKTLVLLSEVAEEASGDHDEGEGHG